MNTRKFTIMHSYDMHGDFLAEVQSGSGALIGELSLLSGYINRVRREEKNVLFTISGDMLQVSLIHSKSAPRVLCTPVRGKRARVPVPSTFRAPGLHQRGTYPEGTKWRTGEPLFGSCIS